jgi:hypothetical protein
LRRPIRSPQAPAASAPKKKPMKFALASTPICTLLSPHSVRSTGSTKAITAASIASKV